MTHFDFALNSSMSDDLEAELEESEREGELIEPDEISIKSSRGKDSDDDFLDDEIENIETDSVDTAYIKDYSDGDDLE